MFDTQTKPITDNNKKSFKKRKYSVNKSAFLTFISKTKILTK